MYWVFTEDQFEKALTEWLKNKPLYDDQMYTSRKEHFKIDIGEFLCSDEAKKLRGG